ncbi:MAG: nucleotidyltransferase [Clostridium sp.]|nr:nucleotidyltransferase [Clostridium sp.]
MNITGLITEYNPLHKGHIYHIQSSKEITNCDGVVCVMSGNFVQRGNPSIIDKWSRAKVALECGIDLVIELPLIYSLSSAEFFAFGAISLLDSLGIVNNICFGSESGNIEEIMKISEILNREPDEFKHLLKYYLDQGLSYPICRHNALNQILEDDVDINNILKFSNNILAIEYCKSLLKLKSSITPFTIKRLGSSYNDNNLTSIFTSATSIRSYLKDTNNIEQLKKFMPLQSFNMISKNFKNESLTFENSIFQYIKYKACTSINTLSNISDASEGLHNKIYKSLISCNSYEELITRIKSKRYSQTRINRILCQYFIGLDQLGSSQMNQLRKSKAPYARVLGFNETGIKILKQMKDTSSIPVYIKLPRNLDPILDLDILSTKAYSIINKNLSPDSDFKISPIRLF